MIKDHVPDFKRNQVINDLKNYGYHDVEGKRYDELVYELTRLRANRINRSHPSDKWF